MAPIQTRRDLAANWLAANPVLRQGEEGYVLDTGDRKMGDGLTPWNALAPWQPTSLKGAAKLVNIGDAGWGLGFTATSTVGTGEMMFTVGQGVTDVAAQWNHWYNASTGSWPDTDPSTTISFNASLRVVSSSNPGTSTNVLFRLTFNGRTTATLDPGGRIVSDILGLSLAPGDIVAIRTYLASGTAYAPRSTLTLSPSFGGFTATTDLTAPGSATIAASQGNYYGPSMLLGYPTSASSAKSVLVLGDSIAYGVGDAAYYTLPGTLGQGNFVSRALTGLAGVLNVAVAGDLAAFFQATGGSFRRLSNATRCNSAIIEYGTNDIVSNGATASSLETILLNLATGVRRTGISKVFLTTLLPRATSTDSWATTTNQTPVTGESQRVAHNTWVRAGCPIDPTALTPVAVGLAGALYAGQFGHPITGIFDTAAKVESSLNSGFWTPCNRVATGSVTTGNFVVTSSTANFNSAKQELGGDVGAQCFLYGAGASGAVMSGIIFAVNSSTSISQSSFASTTVTNAVLNIGSFTFDGVHPSTHGHYLMSTAINPALV